MTPDQFGRIMRKSTLRLLQLHYDAQAGHIGGNLSSLDAMVYLHTVRMSPDDLFVLSKGHAAGALYVSLWAAGKLTESDLQTYAHDGSYLAAHPAANWHPQIPFMTGSLGHGLSMAAGVALGRKKQGKNGRIFCLVSDGELQEGACWEGVVFSVQNRLDNLTVLVDHNGLQGFGRIEDIAAPMLPLADKFRAFGMTTQLIDGHDYYAFESALADEAIRTGPTAIILQTVKGHGVSFMADRMDWHYLPMTAEQYQQAIAEVSGGGDHA